jgi:carbamoyltransferase
MLEEDAQEWFEMPVSSPYMKFTFKCKRPGDIPAVIHEDGTSRVQTVNERQHPGLYRVLQDWKKYSGVPVLLNTSLNVRGEPLVNDEKDILQWNLTHPDLRILS